MAGQLNNTLSVALEVLTDGDKASLRYREFDGVFTYQKPIDSGTVEEMRNRAQQIIEKNSQFDGLTVREIDLKAARESRLRGRSPET